MSNNVDKPIEQTAEEIEQLEISLDADGPGWLSIDFTSEKWTFGQRISYIGDGPNKLLQAIAHINTLGEKVIFHSESPGQWFPGFKCEAQQRHSLVESKRNGQHYSPWRASTA